MTGLAEPDVVPATIADQAFPAPDKAQSPLAERILVAPDPAARRRVVEAALAVDGAQAVLGVIKEASEQALEVAQEQALVLADTLIEGAVLAGRPDYLALGMMAKGDALRVGGDYPASLRWFNRAAVAFEAQGDTVGWARTRIGWVVSRQKVGEPGDVAREVDRARRVLVAHGELRRAAALDLNVSAVLYELGRYGEALAPYGRALSILRALGDAVGAAKVVASRGLVLAELGRFTEALDAHGAARRVFAEHGCAQLVLQEDMNSAYVLTGQGHYARALARLLHVPERAIACGARPLAALAALDLAACYLQLNCHAEALEQAERAIEWFDACGTPIESAKAAFTCASAHAALGQTEPALGLLDRADRSFETAGLDTLRGLIGLRRAGLHLDEGRAEAALREAEVAARRFRAQALAPRVVQAEIAQARALANLGRLDAAESLTGTALAAAEACGVPELTFAGQQVLAGIRRSRGEHLAALAACEAAIQALETIQGRLTPGLRSHFLGDKRGVYHEAIDLALDTGQPALAFTYLERAKSRALADFLARRPEIRARAADPATQARLDALARLREAHNWYYNRLHGGDFDPEAPVDRQAVADRIGAIERQIQAHLRAIDVGAAESWEPVAASGVDLVGLQSLLGDERVMLAYYLSPVRAAVACVSGSAVRFLPLPTDARAVARRLREWQAHLALAAQAVGDPAALQALAPDARDILHALYRLLIEPVEALIAEARDLIIVPYGPAHGLPFHGLFDGRRHLIERTRVSACPSAALWRWCATRPRRAASALVLAHSDDGRLPHALEEAAAVAALLPGECHIEAAATIATLTERAPAHGVIHLAAHGEARLDNPTFAHIKLADGRLDAAGAFGLDLDGALVTLSACETGRGVVGGGDELAGLGRGFLSAGASTLVQSLWRVEDRSTARLMTRFYRGLCAGLPAGEALRQEQLAHLAEAVDQPFLWAPFQLLGHAGARATRPRIP